MFIWIILSYSLFLFQLKPMAQKPTVPILMVTAQLMQPVLLTCATVTPDGLSMVPVYVQVGIIVKGNMRFCISKKKRYIPFSLIKEYAIVVELAYILTDKGNPTLTLGGKNP